MAAKVIVARLVRLNTRLKPRCEDLLQEAWILGCAVADEFDASRGVPFGAFLARRLHFRMIDFLRGETGRHHQKCLPLVSLESIAEKGEAVFDLPVANPGPRQIDARDTLRLIIRRYPRAYSMALRCYGYGYSMDEIGRQDGTSQSNVSHMLKEFRAAARAAISAIEQV